MNSSDQQGSLNMMKRRWLQDHQRRLMSQPYINMLVSQNNTSPPPPPPPPPPTHRFLKEEADDLTSAVIPAVTVVVEGRSICHRISLQNHDGYNSLAKALRHLLVDEEHNSHAHDQKHEVGVDLSNAVPDHIIAYEDIENDLLLAGDLKWKDFVRVAKRLRIIPVKAKLSKRE